MRSFIYSLSALGLLYLSVGSVAAQSIQVRFAQQDGYERLVLKGIEDPGKIEQEQDGNTVILTFPGEVDLGTDMLSGVSSSLIEEIQVLSPQSLSLTLNDHERIRTLNLSQRFILDIYGDLGLPADEIRQQPADEISEAPESAEDEAEVAEVEELREPPPPTRLEQAMAVADTGITVPHTISISTTNGIRFAAFEYLGSLWLLVDQPDIPVPPLLEGPTVGLFGDLREVLVADDRGKAWRAEIPTGFNVYVEGGSLFWRVVFTPQSLEDTDNRRPLTPVRSVPSASDLAELEGVLELPVGGTKSLLSLTIPETGEEVRVVTVDSSEFFLNRPYQYVDMDLLTSPAGVAFIPKSDGLEVVNEASRVLITRSDGLALTNPDLISEVEQNIPSPARQNASRLFDFYEWRMGGEDALAENEHLLLVGLDELSTAGRAERLITMAKLNLAHGRGAEALGYLRFALTFMPEIEDGAAFRALRGVARHVTGQYDIAIEDLSHPVLQSFEEINMWRAATLGNLGDWEQSAEVLPGSFEILQDYPPVLRTPLTVDLSETALRAGRRALGQRLFVGLEAASGTTVTQDMAAAQARDQTQNPVLQELFRQSEGEDDAPIPVVQESPLSDYHQNALSFLKGEMARQADKPEEAIAIWRRLEREADPLHQVRATLALVALGQSNGSVSPSEAVERLDALRYRWRGDDLEIQILKRLGFAQIENEDYLEGFKTLRDTVVLSADHGLSDTITAEMIATYRDIFLTDRIATLSAQDAALLYEEFRELTPGGAEGDRVVSQLAERLISADFFTRATELLDYQLDFRLQGTEALDVAIRLASVQLMDRKPEAALRYLNRAETLLKQTQPSNANLKQRDIDLLRARALADNGDVSASLTLLGDLVPTPDVSRLEAQVAWRSARWEEAAEALRELVLDEELTGNVELTNEQAGLLLRYATALNLSGERLTLRNLRERHLRQMEQTEQGQMFEVITRPRQVGMLTDRETVLEMIGETDMFGDFLETYRNYSGRM